MSTFATRKDALILTLVAALIGGVIGAALVSSTPADAATGDNLVMGRKNYASNITKIIARYGLLIDVRKVNSPALVLNTKNGIAPPMVVNSDTKVTNLNADLLDGYNAPKLQTDWNWRRDDSIANNVNWSDSATVDAPPGGGAILMSGAVGMLNTKASADWVECYFKVNGSAVAGSSQKVYIQPGEQGICTAIAATTVDSGTHTVQFTTAGMEVTTMVPSNGTWWVIMTPQITTL